jgi:hypothetical protein
MVITSKTHDQLVNQYLVFIRKIIEHFTRQLLLKQYNKGTLIGVYISSHKKID